MTEVLSKQEIFNQVADHLLTQKKRSLDPSVGSCQYRGPNGLKCAVGGILSDDEVPYGANNYTVYSIDLPDRLQGHVEFLRKLQGIHDGTKPSRWIEKLSAFAKNKKLSSSVLNKYRKAKTVTIPVEMKPLTKQEIFDKVATHLLTQKKKSVVTLADGYGYQGCAYRGVGGLSCAVGCLITDHEAKNAGEDVPVDVIIAIAPRLKGFEDFLKQLQYVHDSYKPSKWINKLSLLATKEGLNKDVLKQFRKVSK